MALIVIEVFIASSGMPSKSARMSPRWRDGDADLADLAAGERVVAVVAGLGRQVEGDREAGLAAGEVRAVERVRGGGGGMAGVGAEEPGLVAGGLGHSAPSAGFGANAASHRKRRSHAREAQCAISVVKTVAQRTCADLAIAAKCSAGAQLRSGLGVLDSCSAVARRG